MSATTLPPIGDRLRAIGTELGELCAAKNQSYGSSFHQTGEFLELLYPDGIPKAQYGNALALARIYDKLQRIASDQDAFGEDPWADIGGYSILGTDIARIRKAGQNAK